MFDTAFAGLSILLSFVWVVPIGVLAGILVGAMPGLNASGMLAILLPVMVLLPPEVGLVLAVSLYAGGEVGNSYPAVMLNIPGDASSAVSAIEGYPMTARGEGAKALGMCIMGSTIGALFGGLCSLIAAPLLGAVALYFSYVEICIIILFGIVAIAQVSSGGLVRGFMVGLCGLLISTTGTDPMWGTSRGTFDSIYLLDGIPILSALIGLLGISELLRIIERGNLGAKSRDEVHSVGLPGVISGVVAALKYPMDLLRASITGTLVGIIPGTGGTVATFLSYQQAIAWAPEEEKKDFGKGSKRGLVAADAANNACVGGSIVPLLTLGIPGSSSAAVLLVVMTYHGLEIGPRLMAMNGDIAYAIIWSQFIAAFFLLIMGSLLALFAYRLAYVPVRTFIPIIFIAGLIGSFSQNQYVFDMGMMLVFGVIGFFMKKFKYPVVALLLGIILGSTFEANLLRGLRLGFGSPELFFTRPLAQLLWALLAITVITPPLLRFMRKRRHQQPE